MSLLPYEPLPLLTEDRVRQDDGAYRPSFAFPAGSPLPYLSAFHQEIAHLPLDHRNKIGFPFEAPGPAPMETRIHTDMLKLYECGYFCQGDAIELGTAFGRSAAILSRAFKDSGNPNTVFTAELMPEFSHQARKRHKQYPWTDNISYHLGVGHRFLKQYLQMGRRCGFVFVDHDHALLETAMTCALLDLVLAPGGLVLFHDYNDRRNFDPANAEYDVVLGIRAGLDLEQFQQIGIYGTTSLWQRPRG